MVARTIVVIARHSASKMMDRHTVMSGALGLALLGFVFERWRLDYVFMLTPCITRSRWASRNSSSVI